MRSEHHGQPPDPQPARRRASPLMLSVLGGLVPVAAWVGWLGWHALADQSEYPAGRVVGLVVTVLVSVVAVVWLGLRPRGAVNAASVGLVAICGADIGSTPGDGNFFLVSLVFFGTPLYCAALVTALLIEGHSGRYPPAAVPLSRNPAPSDPDRQVAAWRAYRDRAIGSD